MTALIRRLWNWLVKQIVTPNPFEEVRIPGPQHPAPGLLELWQVVRRDSDLLPRCLGLIDGFNREDAVKKAHEIAGKHGIGDYYLTTQQGIEVDVWTLVRVDEHCEPEITVEAAAARLRSSPA